MIDVVEPLALVLTTWLLLAFGFSAVAPRRRLTPAVAGIVLLAASAITLALGSSDRAPRADGVRSALVVATTRIPGVDVAVTEVLKERGYQVEHIYSPTIDHVVVARTPTEDADAIREVVPGIRVEIDPSLSSDLAVHLGRTEPRSG